MHLKPSTLVVVEQDRQKHNAGAWDTCLEPLWYEKGRKKLLDTCHRHISGTVLKKKKRAQDMRLELL